MATRRGGGNVVTRRRVVTWKVVLVVWNVHVVYFIVNKLLVQI